MKLFSVKNHKKQTIAYCNGDGFELLRYLNMWLIRSKDKRKYNPGTRIIVKNEKGIIIPIDIGLLHVLVKEKKFTPYIFYKKNFKKITIW